MERTHGMKREFARCLHALVAAEGTPTIRVLGALSPEAWIQLFESASMPLRRELHAAAMHRCHEQCVIKETLAKIPRTY